MATSTNARALLLAGTSVVLACAAGLGGRPAAPSGLELRLLHVGRTDVTAELLNIGTVPVAVCPCVGPSQRFVVFDVQSVSDQRALSYPEILFSQRQLERQYQCLEPGQRVTVHLDLKKWHPIWRQAEDLDLRVNLLAGDGPFRVRARYVDKGDIALRRCHAVSGEILSAWIVMDAR